MMNRPISPTTPRVRRARQFLAAIAHVEPVTPSPQVLVRLWRSIESDAAAN